MAGQTSLKKRIRVNSIFIAIIPSRLLCQMYENSPGVEFLRALSKLRKRKKHETRHFHVVVVQKRQEMYKKVWFQAQAK